jgi:hypothetical protein
VRDKDARKILSCVTRHFTFIKQKPAVKPELAEVFGGQALQRGGAAGQ